MLMPTRTAENPRLSSRLMTSLMTAAEVCRMSEPGITVDTATARPDRFVTRGSSLAFDGLSRSGDSSLPNDTARSA